MPPANHPRAGSAGQEPKPAPGPCLRPGPGSFSTAPGRGLRRGRAGQRGASQGSLVGSVRRRPRVERASERCAGLRPPLPAGRASHGSGVAAPLWSAMAWLPGGLAELRWGALVALFVAALATLAVYLVQYALLALRRGRPAPAAAAPPVQRDELLEEGGSVLAWALARGSWRRQWRRAWVAALRAEAAERAVSAGMKVMGGRQEGREEKGRGMPGGGCPEPAGMGPAAPGRGASLRALPALWTAGLAAGV